MDLISGDRGGFLTGLFESSARILGDRGGFLTGLFELDFATNSIFL